MNEHTEDERTHHRTWLERLSQALIREPQDRAQLVTLLRDAEEREILDADSLAMIEGVLQVSELRTRDIMIPRSQMITIEKDASLDTILPIVTESAHSRYPVIGENRDQVIGIMLAKDLLTYFYHREKKQDFAVEHIIRKAVFIPESKRLDVLLREFRNNRNHMAIVVDEYGGVAGLVTIEDILEQIVGEIEDEYDFEEEDTYIKKHSETKYIVKALTSIEDFNEYFQDHLSDEECDTIGGIVLNALGHLPQIGEVASLGRYDFKVLNADKRRIHLLQVEVHQ